MTDGQGYISVVDDQRTNRLKLCFGLKQQGHTVGEAENGMQALEKLRTEAFDLVLLDILMPEIDGYQVLQQMDVTPRLGVDLKGKVFLIPSSIRPGEITRVLREGYDAQPLTHGFRRLADELDLDALLMYTHPGLGEETLLSIVISHTLVIILRPDQQDL